SITTSAMETAEKFVKEILNQLKFRTSGITIAYTESDNEFKNIRRRPTGPRPLRIGQKTSISNQSPTPNANEHQESISPERILQTQITPPPQRPQSPENLNFSKTNFIARSIFKQLSPSQTEMDMEGPIQATSKENEISQQFSSKYCHEGHPHHLGRRRARLPGRWVKVQRKQEEFMTPLRLIWSTFFPYPELSILLFVVQLLICIYGVSGIVIGTFTLVELLVTSGAGTAVGSLVQADSHSSILGMSELKMGCCSLRNSVADVQVVPKFYPISKGNTENQFSAVYKNIPSEIHEVDVD
ncbi:hypothetical protein HK096_005999, partial [Nowakowskiella sp. JEL0078]